MKIALIGPTGFVGKAVLTELLARGHTVTAIARQTDGLPPHPNLQAIQADVRDTARLTNALDDLQAVISAFNAGWDNPDIYKDFIAGSRAIVAATKAAGIKRYIVIGGAGSLHLPDGSQLVDAPDFPVAIREGARAARDALDELKRESTLDWTFLSPPVGFHPGGPQQRTGRYRTGGDQPLSTGDGPGTISAADLAVAVVDELEKPQHIGQRFTIAW